MPLCTFCAGITVSNLVPYIPSTWNPESGDTISVCYYHQPTYRALQDSAQSCELCSLFYNGLEEANSGRESLPQEYKMHEDNRIWLISGGEAFDDLSLPKNLSNVRVNVAQGVMREANFWITAEPDDPLALAGDVTGRMKWSDPGSPRSFDQIRSWLDDCEQNHVQCRQSIILTRNISSVAIDNSNEGDTLPTRVINVGSKFAPQDPLFLWETGRILGRYAALSYSWGQKGVTKSFTTKTATREERMKGFDLMDLPATIRDVVIVTRELGLQYIWIDALCIIQDDREDWAAESARMDQVYGNAAITIAAASSKDKGDGVFNKPRKPLKSVELRSRCSDGSAVGKMLISERVGSMYVVLERSPLCSRGWTLQERVLSRRTIHFAEDQLYWECQTHCVAEDGSILDDSRSINRSMSMPENIDEEKVRLEFLRRWYRLVTEFSRRNFFMSSDRLPALSGLSKQFLYRSRMEFAVGIWKEDLPFALLWNCGTSSEGATKSTRRPPWWSWISVDGFVNTGLIHVARLESKDVVLKKLEIIQTLIKIKDANNPLGEVEFAEMVVKGLLRKITRAMEKRSINYGGWIGNLSPEFPIDEYDNEGNSIGEFIPDYDSLGIIQFHALLVCSLKTTRSLRKMRDLGTAVPHYTHYFIGVVKDINSEGYRRVGAGLLVGEGLFDSSQLVTLSLV